MYNQYSLTQMESIFTLFELNPYSLYIALCAIHYTENSEQTNDEFQTKSGEKLMKSAK